MSDPSLRPPRPTRAEPREVIELHALKAAHPELAEAADMHVELIGMYRRVQSRVPLPAFDLGTVPLEHHQRDGHALLRFEDIPIAITDFRLLVRQTSEVLHRFGALEDDDFREIQTLGRDETLLGVAREWYRSAPGHTGGPDAPPDAISAAPAATGMIGHVMSLAMRPFLARCAEVLQQRPDLDRWQRAFCALCGGEPEMAVLLPGNRRQLVCGRCTLRWAFDLSTCPFCSNTNRARITSFATADRHYRVDGCDACQRYLKSFDRRDRPLMPLVDAVAMLPLDAAAIQRGYSG